MAQGFLTVSTAVSRSALPISGANVYVKRSILPYKGDTSNRLMQFSPEALDAEPVSPANSDSTYTTDVDGRTPMIALDAPDSDETFTESSQNIPYGVFDIYVEARGYIPVRADGVQIYSGIDSLLPVNMIPSTGAESNLNVFTIPENTLLLGDKRASQFAVGRTNPEIATTVYIPEIISVHLGGPDEAAENVYVSFPEYIKNVASSEIYPTWPDAALRANIYAQISLALNRIYTEWYPSQGYDFQITNSTAYDQSFVNGRNIFSNIGTIVDEIFNTYIRREGFVEPLFAQYCDGVITSCAGMSQWGSLYLSEQGYIPLRILRYYYGSNIELVSTDNILEIEGSYPGTPLSLGDTSPQVAVIQRHLNRIRENYPSIPIIVSTNGRFGSDTDAAVRAFQRIFGMPVTGIVDRATWYRISFIYTATTDLAELTSEGELPTVPSAPPTQVLSNGSTGANVSLLQYILDYISLFYTNIPPLDVDGSFGASTGNAVREFQRSFGLTADGVVGSETWAKLYEVFDGILGTVIVQSPEQSYPGVPLEIGDSGDGVRLIQGYLNRISEVYPIIPAVPEDGVFGNDTEISVRAFQQRFGIDADGVIGPLTWTRIVEVYNFITLRSERLPTVDETSPEVETAYPGVVLRRGQRGRHIRLLQNAVNSINARLGTDGRINESGIFDSSTENAVLNLQKRLGYIPSGEVGESLWNEIIANHELYL